MRISALFLPVRKEQDTLITARTVAFIGDRETGRAPALLKQGAAPWHHGVISNNLNPSSNG